MNPQTDKFLEIFNSIDFHSIADHPNILIAASFWEPERFCAARVCYKFMRTIDDLIDNHKAKNRFIDTGERLEFRSSIDDWLKMTIVAKDCDQFHRELSETMEKFLIPRWPIEAFANSMIYDIYNDGFSTFDNFLEYTDGASVAPASVFVHLSALSFRNGKYYAPAFDIREAATPCAIFSYLVHIIRDFQKDQLNNLNYFADDLIRKHDLTRHELADIANGSEVTGNFRDLIEEYCSQADKYRKLTRKTIERIRPFLDSRYQLSLEIIFNLYLMIFERIDIRKGTFTSVELNPSPEEIKERVHKTILDFSNN
jgi:phytoene/squalene synthetase